MPEGELKDAVKHTEHMKAAVRSKVEHPFRVVKRQFGYQEVRFKGLLKDRPDTHAVRAIESVDGATNVAGFCRGGAPVRRKIEVIRGKSARRRRRSTPNSTLSA